MAQTVLGGSSVAAHRQDHWNSYPDAKADPRAAHDPLVAQRQLPIIQKIPKTVEMPQVQFMLACQTKKHEDRGVRTGLAR